MWLLKLWSYVPNGAVVSDISDMPQNDAGIVWAYGASLLGASVVRNREDVKDHCMDPLPHFLLSTG